MLIVYLYISRCVFVTNVPEKEQKSKDGKGHKDEYFNFGRKISSQEMFM